MRVARLHGPEDLRIDTVPRPEPGPGEVRVRIEAALTGGTCAKMWRRGHHARLGTAPVAFGHEGAGVIDAVGSEVLGFEVGERVVPADSAPCGTCAACDRGLTAQCEAMVWLTGFFADALLVPARIVRTNLHKIPAGLAPESAALAESLATVIKGHDRTPARRGEHAVVIGTGVLGLLWIRVLTTSGVRVTAIGRRPERVATARAFGADAVLDAAAVARTKARVDLVVDAAGTPAASTLALELVSPGGRVHLFGGLAEGTTIALDAHRLHYAELLLTASFHHTPFHMAEALRLLGEGFVDTAALLETRVPLADLPAWMACTAQGGALKAVVVPG
ncbi:MAG: alcohol dehydrogenase catalytic domain-containing protein [Planctomycetota bacterium]|nr:alcohol dehydrogenase catalytic domain-containing protein [Planctomycetota bacterium]